MGLKSWLAIKLLKGRFPLWVYRLIGKEAGKILKLEDTNMADTSTPTKPFWQSKTMWAAIITAILGAIQPVSAAMGHPIAVPLWIIEVLTGLGLYGLRTASSDLTLK